MTITKPISRFKPISFNQIAANFDKMAAEELKRYDAMSDFNNLIKSAPERAAQLTFCDNLILVLRNSKELDEEQKTAILMSALLDVKKQIADTYLVRSPDNSYVHASIDRVIGVTAENKLDDVTRQHYQRAYAAFLMHAEYMTEVMKYVDKAELLKLNKSMNPQIKAQDVSTAAAVLMKLNPGSAHHVVLKEKILDTSHMTHEKNRKSGLNAKKPTLKNHKFKDSNYTRHYIETGDFTAEEKALYLGRYDTHMRKMFKVHSDIMAFMKKKLRASPAHTLDSDQHMLTAPTVVDGFKNRRITDVEDITYHLEEDEIARLNIHQYKEASIHPAIRLFDKAKLKHAEPTLEVQQHKVTSLRK